MNIDTTQIVTAAQKAAQTFAEQKIAELAKFRADREIFLGRISGIGMAAMFDNNTALAGKVVAVRQALLDLTTQPAVIAATNLPELELAMETAYDASVVLGGMELYLAFKKVDK